MRGSNLDRWLGFGQLRLYAGGGEGGRWRQSDWAERRRAMSPDRARRSSPLSAPRRATYGFKLKTEWRPRGSLPEGPWWRVVFLNGSWQRLEALSLRQQCMTSIELLRLQEAALKLHLVPLKLLLGSIASDGGESSTRGGYLHALGFQYLRTKIHHRMGTIYRDSCTEL
jgi:hypothetical protein